jgi:hypothetical protein
MQLGDDAAANCGHCFGQREKAPGPGQVLRCSRCKEKKPGSEFSRDAGRASGRGARCYPCAAKAHSESRKANKPLTRARMRRYRANHPEQSRRNAIINRREFPKAAYARDVIRNEIKRGRLTRGPCEVCGTDFKVHGHHDDYDKPRVVRWLCPPHHREWHDANGPGANIEGKPVKLKRICSPRVRDRRSAA